jgi:hypothetical protein
MPSGRSRDEAQAVSPRSTIIGILKEAEAGAKSADLCRRDAISEQTFDRWKSKYAGLEVNEANAS